MNEDITIGLADIPAYIEQLRAERDNALRYTELLIAERMDRLDLAVAHLRACAAGDATPTPPEGGAR